MGIRSSMHKIGGRMLETLINADGGDYRGRALPCGKGHQYEFVEYRDKNLLTVLGLVAVKRAYYSDKECGTGYCPKDRAMDIEGTSYSSGVRRMMSRVGAYRSFGLGHEDLYELAGIRVNAKEVERVSEKVGRQVEAFHAREGEAALSDKIVPIKRISRMYMCMDGTGVPVVFTFSLIYSIICRVFPLRDKTADARHFCRIPPPETAGRPVLPMR